MYVWTWGWNISLRARRRRQIQTSIISGSIGDHFMQIKAGSLVSANSNKVYFLRFLNLQTPVIYHSDFIFRCIKILIATNQNVKLQVSTTPNNPKNQFNNQHCNLQAKILIRIISTFILLSLVNCWNIINALLVCPSVNLNKSSKMFLQKCQNDKKSQNL